jgi:hypothetical protein
MYNSDIPSRAELPSAERLLRSTLIALVTAMILLFTVVLPSEYGIDPTGVGRMLGLTAMGEIKQQLLEEAEQEAALALSTEPVEVVVTPPVSDTHMSAPELVTADASQPSESLAVAETAWDDTLVIQLEPGEAAEVKLQMTAGAKLVFEWIADPGHLNSTWHGNGTAGEKATYRNGRAENFREGELIPSFDGRHGWFWRNRSNDTVTLTLNVRGNYSSIKRVL